MFGLITRFFGKPDAKKRSAQRRSEFLHKRKIESSASRLNTLQEVGIKGGIAAQLNYLRKVDAFVFEEMILTAIERKTHTVKRNSRYTGDGGVDGEFFINGQRYFIQAKRYAKHIKANDVFVFASLCRNLNAKGIFVHTGKTGSDAKAAAGNVVEIVSGAKLISLLLPVKGGNTNA